MKFPKGSAVVILFNNIIPFRVQSILLETEDFFLKWCIAFGISEVMQGSINRFILLMKNSVTEIINEIY